MSDVGNMNKFFQQERMFERQIAQKLLSNMRAVWALRKGQDRQLVGLLKRLPPPPELFQTKVWLRYRMASARSRAFKNVLAFILKFIIKPLLDMFQPDPIMMESFWKEEPTGRGERGVIMAPGKPVTHEREPEDEVLEGKQVDLSKVEDFIEHPGERTDEQEDFVGPGGDTENDGSEPDEEDMDM